MGFNRRKMGAQRAAAAEKEASATWPRSRAIDNYTAMRLRRWLRIRSTAHTSRGRAWREEPPESGHSKVRVRSDAKGQEATFCGHTPDWPADARRNLRARTERSPSMTNAVVFCIDLS
jgi:hypothetical protein